MLSICSFSRFCRSYRNNEREERRGWRKRNINRGGKVDEDKEVKKKEKYK
jgi:hypothetical protein